MLEPHNLSRSLWNRWCFLVGHVCISIVDVLADMMITPTFTTVFVFALFLLHLNTIFSVIFFSCSRWSLLWCGRLLWDRVLSGSCLFFLLFLLQRHNLGGILRCRGLVYDFLRLFYHGGSLDLRLWVTFPFLGCCNMDSVSVLLLIFFFLVLLGAIWLEISSVHVPALIFALFLGLLLIFIV